LISIIVAIISILLFIAISFIQSILILKIAVFSYLVLLVSFFWFLNRNNQIKIEKRVRNNLNETHVHFLQNMTHELRTPLNGVIGMTDLLLNTELKSEQLDYLNTVKTSSESLLTIVNDLLDLSRLDTGKFSITVLEVSLEAILDSINAQFYQNAVDKGLKLYIHRDPEVPEFVYLDESRIKQVLINLIKNAVKFTHEGFVELIIKKVSQQMNICTLEFKVIDSGIGMSDEDLQKIFSTFTQVDSSSTRKYGGTGIGLTLSKRILHLMDSTLKIVSKENKGSEFSFNLDVRFSKSESIKKQNRDINVAIIGRDPLETQIIAEELESLDYIVKIFSDFQNIEVENTVFELMIFSIENLTESLKMKEQFQFSECNFIFYCSAIHNKKVVGYENDFYLSKPISKLRLREVIKQIQNPEPPKDYIQNDVVSVLIAEDDEVNSYIFKRMFERLGYTVQLAENGKTAVALFQEQKFDIVFLDGQMPVMTGIEAAGEIRKINNTIPIIALTGMSDDEDRQEFLANGFCDVLAKPVKLDEIRETINKWSSNNQTLQYQEVDLSSFSLSENANVHTMINKMKYFQLIANYFFELSDAFEPVPDLLLVTIYKLSTEIKAQQFCTALNVYIELDNDKKDRQLQIIKTIYGKLEHELSFFYAQL
jgi:signal transduction histidine kinase/CheY-like chemotaxis protein